MTPNTAIFIRYSEYRRFFASPKIGGIEGFDCTSQFTEGCFLVLTYILHDSEYAVVDQL